MCVKGLIHSTPVFTEYIREFLTSSVEDGVSYVEPRILFWSKCVCHVTTNSGTDRVSYRFMVGEDGEENVSHRVWVQIFDRVLNEVRASLAAQGRSDEFVGAKIIYSTLRLCTADELVWYLEDCLALAQEFPHLIAGFDLVGHEDSLKPLIYYYAPLMQFVKKQKELGIQVPFIFHAGETIGDGTAADENLYDALLMGTKRIGHG